MKIRIANSNDTEKICKLFYNTVTTVNSKDYSSEQIKIWAEKYKDVKSWKTKIEEQFFLVAERNEIITGFGSITYKGYIDYMYVHKDYQGQGIATRLLNKLEEKAKGLKIDKVYAEVSITARPFFKSKGFEITKLFTTKVNDVEFEDSIMTKILNRDILV